MSRGLFLLGSLIALGTCALLTAWLTPFNVKMPASIDMILSVVVGKALLTFEVSSAGERFWAGIRCGVMDSALTLVALISLPGLLDSFANTGRASSTISITIAALLVGVIILPTVVAAGLMGRPRRGGHLAPFTVARIMHGGRCPPYTNAQATSRSSAPLGQEELQHRSFVRDNRL